MTYDIRVSLSESRGPIPPRIEHQEDHTGAVTYTVAGRSTTCPECGKTPQAGDAITKIFTWWFHADCGVKHLESIGVNQAWVALALQLERSPSKFTAVETRAIVGNLLRMNGTSATYGPPNLPDPEDGDVIDGTPGFRVIKGGGDPTDDPWYYPVPDDDDLM
ncbi:hypothetical protein AB0F17_08425 [Nonomuraea sp. NPDC026600]|uniref:hypothetical protein n=1 Tax=Nonomuraea sp. NPDC026600 TaxID=3155363 RepID=UPI0034110424